MKAYICKHWHGRHSLLQAVGLNVVVLNALVALVLHQLIAWYRDSGEVPRTWLIVLLSLVCTLVLAWQVVGAFRCATRSIRRYGSSGAYYGVLAVMLVSVAFIYGSLATLSAGFIDYRQEAVDAYTPPKPKFELTLSTTERLVFEGDIDRGATLALRSAAKKLPSGAVLILNSSGGLIVEARGMAKVVEEYGLYTRVTQRCYSACTLVFIAGFERSLGKRGELGFHQYDVYAQSPLPWIEPEKEQQKDRALFQQKQVAKWFLDKADSTPHQSIWVPLREELVSAGVVSDDRESDRR